MRAPNEVTVEDEFPPGKTPAWYGFRFRVTFSVRIDLAEIDQIWILRLLRRSQQPVSAVLASASRDVAQQAVTTGVVGLTFSSSCTRLGESDSPSRSM